MKTQLILYGMALTLIMLAGSLSSHAQDIKFSDKPYTTPVFSATFPAGTEVKYDHDTDDPAFDDNEYEVSIDLKDGSFSTFTIKYSNYLKGTVTQNDVDPWLKQFFDVDGAVTKGPIINSTLGGLSARKTTKTAKRFYDDKIEVIYVLGAVSGNRRFWSADVICSKCTQADADRFFDSIKIK